MIDDEDDCSPMMETGRYAGIVNDYFTSEGVSEYGISQKVR